LEGGVGWGGGGTASSADVEDFEWFTGGEFDENVSAHDGRHSEMLFVETDLFFLIIWKGIRVSNYPMMSMQSSSTRSYTTLVNRYPAQGVQIRGKEGNARYTEGGFEVCGFRGYLLVPRCV